MKLCMGNRKVLFLVVLLLSGAVWLAYTVQKADRAGSIQIQEEWLTVEGLQHDYDFFLIADTHISLCDERDAGLQEKAERRRKAFELESGKNAVKTFQNLVARANEDRVDLAIFAGDITDSAMYASIDFVHKQINRLEMPYLYVTGNHDFEYGEEYFSKKAYRDYFPRLRKLTQTGQQYVIREYADLVVAGINDKNNQFSKSAVKALMPYLKGDKPVVLVLHVPLQPQYKNSELEQQADQVWGQTAKGKCRVLIGETACTPNKTTQKLLDAVFSKDSPVAAVFAGHIHFYNRAALNTDTDQLVTGAGYYGDAVHIHMKGTD